MWWISTLLWLFFLLIERSWWLFALFFPLKVMLIDKINVVERNHDYPICILGWSSKYQRIRASLFISYINMEKPLHVIYKSFDQFCLYFRSIYSSIYHLTWTWASTSPFEHTSIAGKTTFTSNRRFSISKRKIFLDANETVYFCMNFDCFQFTIFLLPLLMSFINLLQIHPEVNEQYV